MAAIIAVATDHRTEATVKLSKRELERLVDLLHETPSDGVNASMDINLWRTLRYAGGERSL